MNEQNTFPGLYNKPCDNPVYFCTSHQVYLSEQDVLSKKCMNKMTADMMSVYKCKSLLTISDYRETLAKKREAIRKINASRIAEGRSSY